MGQIGDVKGGGAGPVTGYSPRVLKNLAGPPLAPQDYEDQTRALKMVGVERVLLSSQVWQSSAYAPNNPMNTPNSPVLAGIHYGFRIEPFSHPDIVNSLGQFKSQPPTFRLPRTIITKGLSKADGGDGETKIWPIASRGWYPHAFSSLQFGLEQLGDGTTKIDGPWEVWGAQTPEAMLINLGELLSTGYILDNTTGLYTAPAGIAANRPLFAVDVALPGGFTGTSLTTPFDVVFAFITVVTSGAIPPGIQIDYTVNGHLRSLFGPAITSAGTFYYSLFWGGSGGNGVTYSIPGMPAIPFDLTIPAQAGLLSGTMSVYADYNGA